MSSYLLDKDIVNSAMNSARITTTSHTSNWIDVNSNAALIGSVLCNEHRVADNDLRKSMADLQDQLRMLRTDVEKKDKLINELSSVRESKVRTTEACKYTALYGVEKCAIDQCKKELCSMTNKYEHVANELAEFKAKVSAKEERMSEMKREIEALKSENCNMNAYITAQRTKIKELECELGGVESVSCKADIAITTLQKDNKELQKTILELESRIRKHMTEREEAERKNDCINGKLTELANHITTITGTQFCSSAAGLEAIIKKIGDIVNDHATVKGKLVTTSEQLAHCQAENKANRETIQRIVNELNKCEKDSVNAKLQMDQIKVERDAALNTKTALEKEIDTLKERMATLQTAWTATKKELESREKSYTGQTKDIKQLENDVLYFKSGLRGFKEQVAALLSDGYVKVEANEDNIKEKVKMLMTSSKDRGLIITQLEHKSQQLANQLTEQINLHKEMECKYQRGECQIVELENRLKKIDNEYCANEVLRDNLKSDRIKYLSFLERMGNILKVSQISADVGLDMNIDLILARAEQLVRAESETLQDKQTSIYGLQRKCKSLKETLEQKELHLDMLRKKVTALEEERSRKCVLEREVEDHVATTKKFKAKVEKLSEQLNCLKNENSQLKASLLDTNGIKCHTIDQDKEIHKLCDRIKELESIKEKQSIKLAKYREEIDCANGEVNKSRFSSDTAVQALSQELRHLKNDLEKAQTREKQLMDFRSVVAKMLGLDSTNLAVADYEIIARIERVIASFNGAILPVHVQPVVHIPSSTSHNKKAEEHYSSSTTTSRSVSPSRRYVVGASAPYRERSPSPHHYHHHHSNSPQLHHHHHHSSSTANRSRSKSPRKVTIDPNSY